MILDGWNPGSFNKLFINYILRLHVKSFIPARRDPSYVMAGSRFSETKFSHVITSARLSGMTKLINTCLQRKIKRKSKKI